MITDKMLEKLGEKYRMDPIEVSNFLSEQSEKDTNFAKAMDNLKTIAETAKDAPPEMQDPLQTFMKYKVVDTMSKGEGEGEDSMEKTAKKVGTYAATMKALMGNYKGS